MYFYIGFYYASFVLKLHLSCLWVVPFSMMSFIMFMQDGTLSCIAWFVTCTALTLEICFLNNVSSTFFLLMHIKDTFLCFHVNVLNLPYCLCMNAS